MRLKLSSMACKLTQCGTGQQEQPHEQLLPVFGTYLPFPKPAQSLFAAQNATHIVHVYIGAAI